MNFAASPVLELQLPPRRSRLVLVTLTLGFATLAGRAAYLQGWNNDFLQAKGESRYSRVIEISANRGRIVDRHGEALAISTPVKSLWAIPSETKLDKAQLDRLAADGILFRRAFAPSSWTTPSVMSMLTGRFPSVHGCNDFSRALPLSIPTAVEHLEAKIGRAHV